jgi:hypothetical protein
VLGLVVGLRLFSLLLQLTGRLLHEGEERLYIGKAMPFAIERTFKHGAPTGRVIGFEPNAQEVGTVQSGHASFLHKRRQKSVKEQTLKVSFILENSDSTKRFCK